MAKRKESKKKAAKKKIVREVFNIGGKDKVIEKEISVKEEPLTKKVKNKEETQLKIIIAIGIILIVFVLSFFFFSKTAGKIEYGGLEYEKIQHSGIDFYHAEVEQHNGQGQTRIYNLYLRNNPKKLKDIVINGEIEFDTGFTINMQEDLFACENTIMAGSVFGQFASAMSIKEVKYNDTITCDSDYWGTTLLFESGEENSISQSDENKDCFVIKIKDCEILEVHERLIVANLAERLNAEL